MVTATWPTWRRRYRSWCTVIDAVSMGVLIGFAVLAGVGLGVFGTVMVIGWALDTMYRDRND